MADVMDEAKKEEEVEPVANEVEDSEEEKVSKGSIVVKTGSKLTAILMAPIVENGKLSIGRLMLAATFTASMNKWYHSVEIPDTMLTVLLTLVGYCLGSKAIGNIKDILSGMQETKKALAGAGSKASED